MISCRVIPSLGNQIKGDWTIQVINNQLFVTKWIKCLIKIHPKEEVMEFVIDHKAIKEENFK